MDFICVGEICFVVYFCYKLENHTGLTCVADLLKEGDKATDRQFFILGFFVEYDPTTSEAKLESPDVREPGFLLLDLAGVPVRDMPVEDQLCRVFGRCQWKDSYMCMQVHSIKSSVRWNCALYKEIVSNQKRFMESISKT